MASPSTSATNVARIYDEKVFDVTNASQSVSGVVVDEGAFLCVTVDVTNFQARPLAPAVTVTQPDGLTEQPSDVVDAYTQYEQSGLQAPLEPFANTSTPEIGPDSTYHGGQVCFGVAGHPGTYTVVVWRTTAGAGGETTDQSELAWAKFEVTAREAGTTTTTGFENP